MSRTLIGKSLYVELFTGAGVSVVIQSALSKCQACTGEEMRGVDLRRAWTCPLRGEGDDLKLCKKFSCFSENSDKHR